MTSILFLMAFFLFAEWIGSCHARKEMEEERNKQDMDEFKRKVSEYMRHHR